MKFSRKYPVLIVVFVFLLSLPAAAQTPKGKSLSSKQKKTVTHKKSSSPNSTGLFGKNKKGKSTKGAKTKGKPPKQVREAEKKKKQQKKAYEKARQKEIKRRYKMQTPETQKRMKQTRKEADTFNTGGKQNIWQRMFGGKKNKKKKKDKKDKTKK